MSSLTNRATREALFKASINRASHGDANDTRGIISELAQLRAKQAALLGYPNYAAYTLYDQMAKTPDAAIGFIDRLAPAVAAKQHQEYADIQAMIDAQAKAAGRPSFKAQPWDWQYYSEQIRKERYDLDGDQLKPYFEINKVLTDGVFYAGAPALRGQFYRAQGHPHLEPRHAGVRSDRGEWQAHRPDVFRLLEARQ